MFRKTFTTEMFELDVRDLADKDVFTPKWWGKWYWERDGERIATIGLHYEGASRLRLSYQTSPGDGGEKTSHNYVVRIDWTEPHFGGERPWFLCPEDQCGRRCAILYGGELFLCRECHDLAYPRENKSGSRWQVARHRLRKLADKLETEPRYGPTSYPRTPDRPKGMHESTYRELLEEYRQARREHRHAVTADMVRVAEAAGADLGLTDEERALLKNRRE